MSQGGRADSEGVGGKGANPGDFEVVVEEFNELSRGAGIQRMPGHVFEFLLPINRGFLEFFPEFKALGCVEPYPPIHHAEDGVEEALLEIEVVRNSVLDLGGDNLVPDFPGDAGIFTVVGPELLLPD